MFFIYLKSSPHILQCLWKIIPRYLGIIISSELSEAASEEMILSDLAGATTQTGLGRWHVLKSRLEKDEFIPALQREILYETDFFLTAF